MKVLQLPITRHWFDLIKTGDKPVEYREYRDHWISRIEGKKIEFLYFHVGYRLDAPEMWRRVAQIKVLKPMQLPMDHPFRPKNGEELETDKKYYCIQVGRLIKVDYH